MDSPGDCVSISGAPKDFLLPHDLHRTCMHMLLCIRLRCVGTLLVMFCGTTSKGNCRHLLHACSCTWAYGVMAVCLCHLYIECLLDKYGWKLNCLLPYIYLQGHEQACAL